MRPVKRLKTLLLMSVCSSLLFHTHVHAQISLDGSTATACSGNGCSGSGNATISGGTIVGANQFHSFSDFNISGGSALFTHMGLDQINNIIARVTGGNVSNINGGLNSDISGANLFFINPNGIVFGPGASINVSGVAHISTADMLTMEDGAVISTDLSQASIFSAAPPSEFGFLGQNGGVEINNIFRLRSSADAVKIFARDIDFIDTNYSGAPLSLYAVGTGTNSFQLDESGFNTSPDGAIRLTDSQIAVERSDYGLADILGVHILANDVFLEDSTISSGADGVFNARDIIVSADVLTMFRGSIGSGRVNDGDAGSTTIDVRLINIENLLQEGPTRVNLAAFSSGASGSTVTSQPGRSGDIFIGRPDSIININNGPIFTTSFSDSISGNITMMGDEINLTETGLFTSTVGESDAGDINLIGREINLSDSFISSVTQGLGNAGDIHISVGDALSLFASSITNSSFSSNRANAGSAGNLTIIGTGVGSQLRAMAVNGIGSEISSTIKGGNSSTPVANLSITGFSNIILEGDAEVIENAIDPSVVARAQSRITTSTFGEAGSGLIMLQSEHLQLNNSVVSSESIGSRLTGSAGNVSIDVGTAIFDASTVSTSTSGSGNAGTVIIEADGDIVFANESAVRSDAIASGQFDASAGSVTVASSEGGIFLDQSQISTTGAQRGQAGSIRISGTDVVLNNQSAIASQTSIDGAGGEISIETDRLLMSGGSSIEAGTDGDGDAGSINISVTESADISEGSRLTSLSPAGADGAAGSIILSGQGNASLRLVDSIISAVLLDGVASNRSASIRLSGFNESNIIQSQILTQAFGEASSGSIRIELSGVATIEDTTISSSLRGEGVANNLNAGDVLVGGDNLDLTLNDVTIEAFAFSPNSTSSAGNIVVQAANLQINGSDTSDGGAGVSPEPTTRITSEAGLNSAAGSISIIADVINSNCGQTTGCSIRTSTSGEGNAGTIRLEGNSITFEGVSLGTSTQNPSISINAGDAGSIFVRANTDLSITNSRLSSISQSNGGAGNVFIDASTARVEIRSSSITTNAQENASNSGIVRVNATDLDIQDSFLIADTDGVSEGGRIELQVSGDLDIMGSNITTRSSGEVPGAAEAGQAGEIIISVGGTMRMFGNSERIGSSRIGSQAIGDARAGAITISSDGGVELSNGASVTTNSASSTAGTITINLGSHEFLILRNAQITTSGGQIGGEAPTGGRIIVQPIDDASAIGGVVLISGTLEALGDGTGALLSVDQDGVLIADPDSIISIAGTLDAPDTEQGDNQGTLDGDFLDASDVLSNACSVQHSGETSTLAMQRDMGPRKEIVLQPNFLGEMAGNQSSKYTNENRKTAQQIENKRFRCS